VLGAKEPTRLMHSFLSTHGGAFLCARLGRSEFESRY
jgi:hypothetical protein